MKKLSLLTLIFTLLISVFIPTHLFAQALDDNFVEKEIILSSESEAIKLYEDDAGSEPILTIPNNTTVTLLDSTNENYSFIRYILGNEDEKEIEGFVSNTFIALETTPNSIAEETNLLEEDSESTTEKNVAESTEKDQARVTVKEDKVQSLQLANATNVRGERLEGIATKNPTYVYEEQSRNSKQLRAYNAGSRLIFHEYSKNWYIATVYLNGIAHTGYIHKNDVNSVLQGYAQLEQTNVYAMTSRNSNVLRSYNAGHLLKYRAYNDSWYEATVILNGRAHTGYINRNDVGASLPILEAYAQPGSTHVYEDTSRNAKVLRSYRSGHLLKFRPHNNNWYIATVFLNGVAHTGYIHKSDVGNKVPTLQGYAQIDSTNVYEDKTKTSNVLKSYRAGHLLKFRPYDDDWYEATVIINGQAKSGFIYRNDIGNSIPSLQGLATKQSTPVYSNTSRNSKVLRTYRSGHLLKYRPYNNSWYEATVYLNGIAHTGYIHHQDVINSVGKTVMIDAGHGDHDPGAIANGLQEKDIVLDLALRTRNLLEDAGFTVIMTRSTDTYLTLQERSALANSSNVDIFVSIHVNAGGGTGVETYWFDRHEPVKSEGLAATIQEELVKETEMRNRGVKKANFHVIRETQMPSALVEVGFIDHQEDAQKLQNDSFLNRATQGIVNGIKKFFQLF